MSVTLLQQQMQRLGVRRLLVFSGETQWCEQQAVQFCAQNAGDWLWLSDSPPEGVTSCLPSAAHTLLGQEIFHGVFDARYGLNIEALAAFSGTLKAGSWLILLIPAWDDWADTPDADSLRWSEQPQAIPTPRFIRRFQSFLEQDRSITVRRQDQPFDIPPLPVAPDWLPPDGQPTAEQSQILKQLMQAQSGVWVLTAPRGRGKSTLAGMLVRQWPGICWVTAPAKASASQILNPQTDSARFIAPDALLALCREGAVTGAEWLIIDEAAAIPAPMLAEIIAAFPRVLLTTTVQGYEGTGRGFLLKFCTSLPQWHDLRLNAPIRWSSSDTLEPFISDLLLFDEHLPVAGETGGTSEIFPIHADDWLSEPVLLEDFYGLLTSAHYRTSPLDLRRLLDAPGMTFSASRQKNTLTGALWLVDEGGLSAALAQEVWAGRRRPRGNLVAQSLAAHAGFPEAAVMRSRRVSRIAVHPAFRRQGIARQLLAEQKQRAQQAGLDFLSVSFGYTPDLAALWQQAGFRLVRVSTHKEASSGCYAAMAILPLSAAGQALADSAVHQLHRDWRWLAPQMELTLPPGPPADTQPDDADWRELRGFAFAHRPLESSLPALSRVLLHSDLPLTALRACLQQGKSVADIVQSLQLSGRKALVSRWREEAQQVLKDAGMTG
ncbi:putative P-loop ATPase/acetyltransferase [Rahnella aquatilis CIP 78.65 = ATCC 33071]|uniref:tRNA(Met) cytidine acetyltransferase TmcA n=1 Tax=Rahnella aquatilis (strain ATCC 33071 / DSM 4594 / JCM 1683 / NBRC 105701 / NCIMB 13365 / CIP 78.65) TaxID=745277 RepID=H2IY24_RAHAC|nr:GNAT family N-acetyltransferase [Rahnella aquatilis]AEX53101.1 putative P-loop ATPase fused to an acetyltransferase [Rahnella aquatilis CIP 78.65 = ATCC 33071]KFD04509.1 putative P-loop ATPase/acetyltransferase [Rahnella aquatilis CIP 78.65 = ATCC 33071]